MFNNPLTLVDPTGMFSWRKFIGVFAVIVSAIVMPHLTTMIAKFWFAVGSGFVTGAISTGSLKGGLIGAFSAAVFFGIGTGFDKLSAAHGEGFKGFMNSGLSAGEFGAKVLAHGITGGVMSALSGGKFGDGFAGAGVAQLFSPAIDTIGNGAESYAPLRVAAAALLGGTASVLSGGKFANGAITAAFSRAFNEEAGHRRIKKIEAERKRIVAAAMRLDGDESYSYMYPKGNFPVDSWKCNLGVKDVLTMAGIPAPMGSDGVWPIVANTWADPSASIPGFKVVQNPMSGDIAAMPNPNGPGHVGVYVGSDGPSNPRVMAANQYGFSISGSHYHHGSRPIIYRRWYGLENQK